MYINYVRFGYEMNIFSKEHVQDELLAGFTNKPVLRRWWEVVAPWWEDAIVTGPHKQRRFAEILHGAANRPPLSSPPSDHGEPPGNPKQPAVRLETVMLGVEAAKLAVGVALVFAARRSTRRN